jgi:hypothetical protein
MLAPNAPAALWLAAHLQIRTNFCGRTPRLTQNRFVARSAFSLLC